MKIIQAEVTHSRIEVIDFVVVRVVSTKVVA